MQYTNRITIISNGLMVIATVVIAFATVRGVIVQQNMVEVSNEMVEVTANIEEREETRFQAELRPYVTIEYEIHQNLVRTDGNSDLFLKFLPKGASDGGRIIGSDIVIPHFRLKNIGKLPALNISAICKSPVEPPATINVGDKSLNLNPDEKTSSVFSPNIVIDPKERDSFKISLEVMYSAVEALEANQPYVTTLEMTIQRVVSKESGIEYKVLEKILRLK